VLYVGEAIWRAFKDPLEELPFHLKRFLEGTVGGLGEVGTGLGEAMDVGLPFLCFGGEPIDSGLWVPNEAT